MKSFVIEDETQWSTLTARLAKMPLVGSIIFLHGVLGAGKTTFVRSFLHQVGYAGKVKSPTYTLIESYQLPTYEIYHLDLFRLNSAEDLSLLGLNEYFHDKSICLIEWPEKSASQLPAADLDCYIEIMPSGRRITIQSSTIKGKALINQL